MRRIVVLAAIATSAALAPASASADCAPGLRVVCKVICVASPELCAIT